MAVVGTQGIPGPTTLTADGPGEKDAIKVHAFVMVPARAVKNGMLTAIASARIRRRRSRAVRCTCPRRIIEAPRGNQDTKVSPHFVLKQFLCKEDASKQFPKYIVLQERLPLKLEAILERVNAEERQDRERCTS